MISEKRELGDEYKNHVRKYLEALRTPLYGLQRAADWLEAWVDGRLPVSTLLDVDPCLGFACHSTLRNGVSRFLTMCAHCFSIRCVIGCGPVGSAFRAPGGPAPSADPFFQAENTLRLGVDCGEVVV